VIIGLLSGTLNANFGASRFHHAVTQYVLSSRPEGRMTEGGIMKKIARKLLARITAILILMMLLCGVSACSWDKFYYAGDPDPVKAVTDTFGTPLWVEVQPDGSEKLVYRVPDPMGWSYYHRYFIVKNGKVTGGGIQ